MSNVIAETSVEAFDLASACREWLEAPSDFTDETYLKMVREIRDEADQLLATQE